MLQGTFSNRVALNDITSSCEIYVFRQELYFRFGTPKLEKDLLGFESVALQLNIPRSRNNLKQFFTHVIH